MPTDAELLRAYADEKSESAFGELVRRQVNLVYLIALRQCGGDAHLAEDVAQRVFTDLARKARQLSGHAVLGGWLYRSAQFAASDVVRAERRRRAREQEASAMQKISDSAAGDADWQKLAPVLDQAIGELAARDRDAVVLRFFEGRPFAEIGATLRLTEDAARMRVERALDKLRAALVRRGITSTTAALGVALANQVSIAAPAGLAASVTGAALAGVAANGSAGALLAFLTMSKIKFGIVSTIVVAVAVTGVVELRANRELRAELGALRAGSDDTGRLQKENQQLNAALQKLGAKNPEADALVRLNGRIAQLKARPEGVIESDMKPWTNAGRATPETALATFYCAMSSGDLDLMASFIVFSDDSKENREAFMAAFSDAVRAKYRTPERLCAAAFFPLAGKMDDPVVTAQIFSMQEDHGPEQLNMRTWYRTASGREAEARDRLQRIPEGWALAGVELSSPSIRTLVLSRIDAATGEPLPAKK